MSKIEYDLTRVKAFVFDIDGVLSPATVPIDEDGIPMRMTNIRDGYAFRRAVKSGYPIAIITGGTSEIVIKRFNILGIKDVFIGVKYKKPVLEQWMLDNGLTRDEVAYMGDDIPDLVCMRAVGLACAPYDAAWEVLATARFVSKYSGGYGCARDLMEQVMRSKGEWPKLDEIV
ncbi:MAG: HAD hydrolase-like protein [Muribaculaceae bacterium]|nr:HAD hydrolase-like protein [Muribaculaceae bacterium]